VNVVLAALGALSLPSCGILSSDDGPLARVDELISCVERVHVDADVGRDRAAKALAALQAMAAPDFRGDAVLAHAELQRAIELAQKHAKDLRYSVDRMKRAAEPVFHRWNKDLAAMQNPELKQRGEARLKETRQRYDAIVAAVDPTLAAFDALNRSLQDHALFLAHDFNAASVAAIADQVRKLENDGRELHSGFDRCMAATRAYVDHAALPMRVEAARPQ